MATPAQKPWVWASSTFIVASLAPSGEIDQDTGEFARHLEEHLAGEALADQPIEDLRLNELFLCWACLQKNERAVVLFDDDFLKCHGPELSRVLGSPSSAEELLQQMRTELLVGSEQKPPLLTRFSGTGALRKWLKVVLMRAALKVKKRDARMRPASGEGIFDRLNDAKSDPELQRIRELYREAFNRSVEQAFMDLSAEQRNLLRMYVIDKLTMNQLAAIHQVSEASISRWLARIRDGLKRATREHLAAEVDTGSSEWKSLVRILGNEIEISVERLLQ